VRDADAGPETGDRIVGGKIAACREDQVSALGADREGRLCRYDVAGGRLVDPFVNALLRTELAEE